MADLTHEEKALAEFQTLSEKRDLAAWNCVNAIQFVLAFFEANEFERSREILQEALDLHKKADQAIADFHLSRRLQARTEKENSHHAA